MQYGSTGYGGIPFGGNTEVIVSGATTYTASVFDTIAISEGGTFIKVQGPLSQLLDNFNDGGLDPAIWTTYTVGAGTVVQTGGQLQITATTTNGSTGMYANLYYYLDKLEWEVVNSGVVSGMNLFGGVYKDFDEHIAFEIGTTNIIGIKRVGGVNTDVFTIAYNAVNHRFLRIRSTAGTTYWETSPDSITWTTQASEADPINLTEVWTEVFINESAAAGPGTATLDNINTTAASVSVSDSVGITESVTAELVHFAAPFEAITITEDVYLSPFLFGIETVEDFLALPWTFTDYYEAGGTVNIDTTSKVNGVNSLRFDGAGVDNIALIARHLATQQSSIFVRMSGFFPTGFSFGTAGYSGILSGVTFGNTNSFYFNLEDYGTIRLSVNGDNITFRDTGIDLPVNSVWTLQIQVIKSATVGRVRVWLNNSVEASPDYDSGDINSGTIGIDKIHFGKTYVPNTVDSFYLDDFIIDDEYILPSFAAPTVDTFDAIGITESTSAELTHNLSVFDAVTIAESITPELTFDVSTFDTVGITENVASDLTFNVSTLDTVGITENVASDLVSVASVFDAIGITENVTLDLIHNLSTFDAVAIAESVTPDLTFNVSTFDAIAIAEDVVALIVLEASVFDLITIEDIPLYYPDHIYIEESVVVVLVIPPFEASVFDSIAILESNTQELNQFVSVFDAVGIAENITLDLVSNVSVFDAVGIAENITLDLVSNVSVFDAVGIAEAVTLELNSQASVFDAVAIAESVTVSLDTLTVSVFDAIGITEDVALDLVSNISVFDAIGIAEDVALDLVSNISVFDAIGIAEDVALSATSNLEVNVFDSISIVENVTTALTIELSVADTFTITEAVTTEVVANASVFDAIGITEDVAATPFFTDVSTSVFDAIGITENVASLLDIPVLTINAFDIIGIEEFITSETAASVAVQDNITIAEDVNPNQIFNAQLLFDSIVFAESITSETIRFSPEPPNKRPRGRRAQIIPRGSASTPQQTGSRINIAGKGVVTSR